MLLAPLPAAAETSLSAYDAVRQALIAVFEELPLSVRNATLVKGTPKGLGVVVRAGAPAQEAEPVVERRDP